MNLRKILLILDLLAVMIMTPNAAPQDTTTAIPEDAVYANPGKLVDAGGFRLNLYCMGSGSPTVVFDSGWGDWAPAWSKVQPQIAKCMTRQGEPVGDGTVSEMSRLNAALDESHHRLEPWD